MREMVLNHASLASPDRHAAVEWLRDVTTGMAQLTQHRIAEPALRMCKPHSEILSVPGWSLWDILQEMRKVGARDEYAMFSRLTSKIPLLVDVDPDVENRFRFCEARTLPSPDGDPLLIAAITDGISVGFPSEPIWDSPQLTVIFDEMFPNGDIKEASEEIDNLTRSKHAKYIYERHRSLFRDRLREFRDGVALWSGRQEAFPNLRFGPDVEEHLAELNPAFLGGVVSKLASLDDCAAKWHEVLDSPLSWEIRVTDESESVKNDARLRELRRFASSDGTHQLFMWHARFGGGGRIHFRLVSSSRRVEIGYIGPHLRTRLFG